MKSLLRTLLVLIVGFVAGMLVVHYTTGAKTFFSKSDRTAVKETGTTRSSEKPLLDRKDTRILEEMDQAVSQLAKAVTPAVVNVLSSRTVTVRNPLLEDPFFRRFFGRRVRPQQQKTQSLGSGVVLTQDGIIASSYHVVQGAEQIKVILQDGRELDAQLVGSDPASDIVLLKVSGKNFATVPFGDSDALEVGDFVLAVGNPYGFGHTVTRGIVSAVNRSAVGLNPYEDFIQIDAAINPGNSGGALVNSRGELVGINSAIISKTGGFHGIGLAIPSNLIQHVLPFLMKGEPVSRGWLGIQVIVLNENLAKKLDYQGDHGLVVYSVESGSPAEQSGIEPADILLRMDGKEMRMAHHLRTVLGSKMAKQTVEIVLWRKGKEMTLTVTLADMPTWDETLQR